MSSVTRRGKVWHARYRDASGERVMRSTKMTDKKKALEVLAKWEATARGELVATHVQRAMADIYRQATGKEAPSGVHIPSSITLDRQSTVTTTPSPQTKWEYKELTQFTHDSYVTFDSKLSEMGNEGWELVSVQKWNSEVVSATYVFKRPKR